jgi:hypothetical protein
MEDEKQELMAKANMFAETKDLKKVLNNLPTAPLGEDFSQSLEEKLNQNKLPDKKENKHLDKKLKKIYRDWRNNCIEQIDLENYKKWCDLQVVKAESDRKIANIKREQELEAQEHWLKLNKGNLEEIKYNTTSKPNGFWYYLNRGIFHINKTFSNIPKLVWKILGITIGIGAIILSVMGIIGVRNNVL